MTIANDPDALITAKPEHARPAASARPTLLAQRYAVSSSHHYASHAGLELFELGGNAIDAGVAAGFAMNVVAPHYCDLGGVAPLMVFQPGMREPVSIDGLGWSPRAADLASYTKRYGATIPAGAPRAIVPAALDAWLTALGRFGRLPLKEVLAPAIALAEGFPVYQNLATEISRHQANIRAWPSSAAVFMPNGRPPRAGEVMRRPELAALFRELVAVSERASGGRAASIRAARDHFYTGEPARIMAEFIAGDGGMLDYRDIAEYSVRDEPPLRTSYRGYDVYASGPWSQGPIVPLTLAILRTVDLRSLRHNSAQYIHFFSEALKLAFADREAFVGDPSQVDVPIAGMISEAYGEHQARRIDRSRAGDGMPAPGDPWSFEGRAPTRPQPAAPVARSGAQAADTTYICAMDAEGNAFSATPSDNCFASPLVPDLGIVVSPRGSQFWLDPAHPSVIAPRKRPRLTPNPAMLLRAGRCEMPFGAPGGDAQPQAMLQVLCNVLDHGMDVQPAIEAARFRTWSFPNSFWPHAYEPNVLTVEEGIDEATVRALSALGHKIERWGRWVEEAAGVCAIRALDNGVLAAGADPRRDSYAVGR